MNDARIETEQENFELSFRFTIKTEQVVNCNHVDHRKKVTPSIAKLRLFTPVPLLLKSICLVLLHSMAQSGFWSLQFSGCYMSLKKSILSHKTLVLNRLHCCNYPFCRKKPIANLEKIQNCTSRFVLALRKTAYYWRSSHFTLASNTFPNILDTTLDTVVHNPWTVRRHPKYLFEFSSTLELYTFSKLQQTISLVINTYPNRHRSGTRFLSTYGNRSRPILR